MQLVNIPTACSNFSRSVWRRMGWLIASCLVSAPLLVAQDVEPASTDPSYLMRMERQQWGRDACILVRGDGQYHLEIISKDKTKILEGVLPQQELRDLIRTLSLNQLFRLHENDIYSSMLSPDIDLLLLWIHRPGYWQDLSFPTAESRNAFREALGPLLTWFDQVQKVKGRTLSEEAGKNNCLVPAEIQLKTRPSPDSATGIQRPSTSAYMIRELTTQIANRRQEEVCLIVFDSGIYHKVREWRNFGSKEIKMAVSDGTLSADDIHSLRVILDSDELRKYVSDLPPRQFFGEETTITHLAIPRSGPEQEIDVWRFMNRYGAGMLPGLNDHDTKLVKPLNEWINSKIPPKKESQAIDPPNPRCLPTP
jgi:hypothetical protein